MSRGVLLWVMGLMLCCSQFFAAETEVYFSSEVDLVEKLVEQITGETLSIQIAYARLSHPKLIEALILAQKRGVAVEVIADRSAVTKNCLLKRLAQEGIPVFIWKPLSEEKAKAHMYYGFCLFGEERSWLGSRPFCSKLSAKESACLIKDRETNARYAKEFLNMKALQVIALEDYIEKKNFP